MRLSLCISNIDEFLKGDYDFAFSVLSAPCPDWAKTDSRVFVCEFEADISNVDTAELNAQAIEIIEARIEKEREEYNTKVAMLEQKKSEYLALTPPEEI